MTAVLNTLASFNGAYPVVGVITDANGDLFGTTDAGGASGDGTVFVIVNTGTVAAPQYTSRPTTLVSFNGADGGNPIGGLIADANCDLFGTTAMYGDPVFITGYGTVLAGSGTAFEIVNSGTLAAPQYASTPATLVNFIGPSPSYPGGNLVPDTTGTSPTGLIADANGDVFGTTLGSMVSGPGTVFEMVNTGTAAAPQYASTPTTLVSFEGTDVAAGALIADANGDLFDATTQGQVFEIVNTGTAAAPQYASTVTTLANFNGSSSFPSSGLIIDANGDLFGSTIGEVGTSFFGTVFEMVNIGTAAAPQYASTPTTLVSFNSSALPSYEPDGGGGTASGLILDAKGDLFGLAYGYGPGAYGTVFEIMNTGTVAAPQYASTPTTVVTFNGDPSRALIADANGDLFGTTQSGGGSDGTVFEITGSGFVPFAASTGVAPTITGTAAGQTTTSEAPVTPFSHVTIGDTNVGATDTLSIQLTGGGTLADGTGFTGLVTGTAALYTLTGTAAAITAELDALVFKPAAGAPGTSATTTFTLTDTTSVNTRATDSTTSVIDSDPGLPFTTPAAISGIAQEGQVLTAVNGTISGAAITGYQWTRNGVAISGATAATYTVTEADEGAVLRVVETATNAGGTAVATSTSAPTAAVTDITLAFTTPASITGTAQEGQVLTAVNGTLNDSDAAVTAYQWTRNGAAIGGATAATYTVTEADEGAVLRVVETATDADGGPSITSTSAATAAVIDAAPTVTKPTITGIAQDGSTLTASATAGQSDSTVIYQWMENSGSRGSYQAIAGATGATYQIKDSDEGYKIEVVATVTTSGGSVSKTSAATAAVTEPAPTLTVSSTSLTLPKGGTVALGVSVTPFDSDDNVKVTINGIATYEYITDGADSKTFTGRSVTLTATEVNSGLTLHSTYTGSAKPVNTLSLTAANTTAGESATSAVQTISVTDPPPSSAGGVAINGTGGPAAGTGSANVALLLNYMANAFVGTGNGHGETLIADPSPAQQSLLTQPHH